MVILICIALDDHNRLKDDAFSVKVEPDDTIDNLKREILKIGPSFLKTSMPSDLLLWKPKEDLTFKDFPTTIQAWRLNHQTHKEDSHRATHLSPFSIIQDEYSFPLPNYCIHVLVQLPASENGKRKRVDEDEGLLVQLLRSKHLKAELPALGELATIAERPLSEEEKIPLQGDLMESLISRPLNIQGKRDHVPQDEALRLVQLLLSKHTKAELSALNELVTVALSKGKKIPLQPDLVESLISRPLDIQGKAECVVDENKEHHALQLWRSKHSKAELPALSELATIAERPLSEKEKIPLKKESMQSLITHSYDIHDPCTAEDVAVLFRSSEHAGPLSQFYFPVILQPPSGGTKDNFHCFWDRNIRDLVELIIPDGKTQRNSNRNTATRSLRPDFAFLLNNFCPFRGEEKAPDSTDDPKAQLAQKLDWAYDPAPYVLGYYATGPNLTLAAIVRPPPGTTQPVVYDIAHADLRHRKQRILNLRRMINLTGIIRALAGIVQQPDPEFEPLERENSTVEIVSRAVIKTYKKLSTVTRLRYIYALLDENNVPNVDRAVLFDDQDKRVILAPRGIAKLPMTEGELLGALECVLETLQVIHSLSLFHRDIRWANIIKRLDAQNKWFVIDWEDAEGSPTHAQPHFSRETHSPRIFIDGHGAEVDMWGVGGLILQCNVLDISPELQDLAKWMQQMPAPSAQKALSKVRQYQSVH